MFKKLLGSIGGGSAAGGAGAPPPPSSPRVLPYPAGSPANDLYDLLFCDDPAPFRPLPGAPPVDWQRLLFGEREDPAGVAALARDTAVESRVRALAFSWLRTRGHEVPKGVLLGVVIEAPLDGGLDVIAAYADGGVRYLNQTGRPTIIEPGGFPQASQEGLRLVELAGPVVAMIGPWDKPRLPPPAKPNIRLSFVVSDGLYFGQGPWEAMERDPKAGPLIQQAGRLLQIVVDRNLGTSGA